jgi:type VI protein secretion system component Hcp
MKKIAFVAGIALLAIAGSVVVFKAASSSDSSSRKAAIGSGAPVAGGASVAFTGVSAPAPLPANGAAIKVTSWKFGAENNTTVSSATGGAGAGKLSFDDFTITKNIDNASTALFAMAATGTRAATMTFKVGTALTYTFTNVWVTKQTQTGSDSDGDEEVSFVFAKVCQVNAAAGPSPQQCWNVTTNTAS